MYPAPELFMCEIDPHDGKGPPRLQVSDLSRRSFAALSFFAGVAAASPLRAAAPLPVTESLVEIKH